MASKILHFGIDYRAVLPTLLKSGYDLDDCGTSIMQLNDALRFGNVDAVVISECDSQPHEQAVNAARSRSSASLILFEKTRCASGRESFDLVIPARIPSAQWLNLLAQLLANNSEAVQARAQATRERAEAVQTKACAAQQHSAVARAESQCTRVEAATILQSTPPSPSPNTADRADRRFLSSAPVRVLIVDDHERWREVVCRLLNHGSNFQIIGQAADGMRAIQLAGERQPQLILLDIGMPGMSGLEAARHIFRAAPETKIIFVTQDSNTDFVEHALSTGAHGYVLKTDAARELPNAIHAALQNHRFVSSSVAKLLRCQTSAPQ